MTLIKQAGLIAGLAFLFAVSTSRAADIEIPYTEFTLDNGLRVIVHEDHKAPIVAVNIWYHVGSKNEKPGKTGFAHLFEHLMFNGSENYNDEYFKPFKRIGATAQNGTTWLDRTNYFQNVPTTAVDTALWMESDRMGHMLGAVTQDRLDEQRGVVQNEKAAGRQPALRPGVRGSAEDLCSAPIIRTPGRRSGPWRTSTPLRSRMSRSGSRPTTARTTRCSCLQVTSLPK